MQIKRILSLPEKFFQNVLNTLGLPTFSSFKTWSSYAPSKRGLQFILLHISLVGSTKEVQSSMGVAGLHIILCYGVSSLSTNIAPLAQA